MCLDNQDWSVLAHDYGLNLPELYQDEYLTQLLGEEQDNLTRELGKICITEKVIENESELSIDSPIDPTVWKFVLLLSEKLEESTIPNLFGSQASPTTNLLVSMLENHKLRST